MGKGRPRESTLKWEVVSGNRAGPNRGKGANVRSRHRTKAAANKAVTRWRNQDFPNVRVRKS